MVSHKIGRCPTFEQQRLLEIKKELSLNICLVWEYAIANKSSSLGHNL